MVTRGQAVARTVTWDKVLVMPPTAKETPPPPPCFEFLTQSLTLRIAPEVVDRLEKEAIESFKSITKKGSEVGGLLLGRMDAIEPAVHISDFELFDCGYTRGPLYLLSDQEKRRLELALRKRKGQDETVVGFFRSNTRKDLVLDEDDEAVIESLFHGTVSTVLLIKPFSMKPSTAAFFVWHNGRIAPAEGATSLPFRRSELVKLLGMPESAQREEPSAPIRLAPKRAEQATPASLTTRAAIPVEPPEPAPPRPAPVVEPPPPAEPEPAPVAQEPVLAVVEPPPPPPVMEAPKIEEPPAPPPPAVEPAPVKVPQRSAARLEASPRPALPVKPLIAQPATASRPEVSPRPVAQVRPQLPPRPAPPARPAAVQPAPTLEPAVPAAASPAVESPAPAPAAAAPLSEPLPGSEDVRFLFANARLASLERAHLDPPPQRSQRRRWVIFSVVSVLLMAACAVGGAYYQLTARPLSTSSGTANSLLSLNVERSGGQFRLTWDRHASAIKAAQKAELTISDGSQNLLVPLSSTELRSGVFSYTPNSSEVTFRLELSDLAEGRAISESIRSGASRPSAFGSVLQTQPPTAAASETAQPREKASPAPPAPAPTASAPAVAEPSQAQQPASSQSVSQVKAPETVEPGAAAASDSPGQPN